MVPHDQDLLEALIPIRFVGDVDSTMAVAARMLDADRSGASTGIMVIARSQTAGRGRLGRSWASPPGGLWATLAWLMNPHDSIDGLGLRVGAACLRTIRQALDRHASAAMTQYKWPNDILIDAHKVCGCLTQIDARGGRRACLIGVGMNANIDIRELPPLDELRRPATSLSGVLGRDIDLPALARCLRANLHVAMTNSGVPADDIELARASLFGVGMPIEGSDKDGGRVRGTLLGLDDAGRPVIRVDQRTVILADADPA